MEEIYKERRPFVAEFLANNPRCEIFWDSNCTQRSVDVHEVIARGVGGDIVGGDLSNYKAVCRYCHTMITNNPKEAQERGFIKWSWEK
jgi:thymidine kinase